MIVMALDKNVNNVNSAKTDFERIVDMQLFFRLGDTTECLFRLTKYAWTIIERISQVERLSFVES